MGFFETEKSNPLTAYLVSLADLESSRITNVERLQVVDGALIFTGPQRELIHMFAPGVWTEITPQQVRP